jgi:hypothetical protein
MQSDLPRFASGPPLRLLPPLGTGIAREIYEGMQRYTAIRAPVLAIYAVPATIPAAIAGDSVATQRWLIEQCRPAATFARGVPTARVVMIANADHGIYNSHPAIVLGEMRAFISKLPPPR